MTRTAGSGPTVGVACASGAPFARAARCAKDVPTDSCAPLVVSWATTAFGPVDSAIRSIRPSARTGDASSDELTPSRAVPTPSAVHRTRPANRPTSNVATARPSAGRTRAEEYQSGQVAASVLALQSRDTSGRQAGMFQQYRSPGVSQSGLRGTRRRKHEARGTQSGYNSRCRRSRVRGLGGRQILCLCFPSVRGPRSPGSASAPHPTRFSPRCGAIG
jgi:hypothetical protein